ncbi:maleylacetoacetate isomerase [Solilutibacter tolerans]|uniref:Maleylacetoacetate isomerase n=1 Tax=Solilutibacter tolerans TaxID=1604334 RepID=A0A1N6N7T0_9GAMM|nr:maleylacetoacetate isomerase [Lysobacter tolerans]SIP88047.1 maleylacetoacetate isomerase [Lysobacter tolerans]
MSDALTLYSYWRSSAAYRVRIGLNLKGLDCKIQPVHLVRDGGEQRADGYRALNPQQLVPTLLHGERRITQSMAILEYIDECWPKPALLPTDARGRARVRALSQLVACDIHPLNNLRVLQYLKRELGTEQPAIDEWMRHWMREGFSAMQAMLADSTETGAFCHGESPTMADCCLIPQLFNARRFDLDLSAYPELIRIEANALALPAFERARPENQPDAE